MQNRKIIAAVFILLALLLGTLFYLKIEFPQGLEGYFKAEYYNQFGPLAISIELLIAGIYLFTKNEKTNFTLAVFAFTALLDPFFNLMGLFTSLVPTYAMILLVCCAVVSLWLVISNFYQLKRISFLMTLVSFIIGSAIELFFNYFLSN